MSAPGTPRSGPGGDLVIRPYEPDDEGDWLECRLLAFFDTAYYDDVVRSKTSLVDGSFELVAEDAGKIVGLIDIELDSDTATIDSITTSRPTGSPRRRRCRVRSRRSCTRRSSTRTSCGHGSVASTCAGDTSGRSVRLRPGPSE